METNSNTSTGKKRLKEYLLEGLMIFVAVSMGFIAENIREYFSDKERELQYVEAFVKDLKADTASINKIIQRNIVKGEFFDSLLIVSNTDLHNPVNAKKLIYYFVKGTYMPIHLPATVAINQLKSTGSLRIISNKNGARDSIIHYESANDFLKWHNDLYSGDAHNIWETFYPVFDIKLIRDTSYIVYKPNKRMLTEKALPPLRLSDDKLSIFLGAITRHILINEANRIRLQNQLTKATNLIRYFNNEYHLEK